MKKRSVVAAVTSLSCILFGSGAVLLSDQAPASAAPQTSPPFACTTATDFLVEGTQLYTSPDTTSADVWTKLGGTAAYQYNSIGFDPLNNYIYGMDIYDSPDTELVEIGSDGSVVEPFSTGVAGLPDEDFASGAFDPSGNYWVIGEADETDAYEIDVTTNSVINKVALSQSFAGIDLTWDYGYMWGLNGSTLYRLDLSTGIVNTYSVSGLSGGDEYLAAWTFANGNLGFSGDSADSITRIVLGSGLTSASVAPEGISNGPNSELDEQDGTSCSPAPVITSLSTLPSGQYGSSYAFELGAISLYAPASWTVISGTVPPGLTVNSEGDVTGIPTAAGTYSFEVEVTENSGFPETATADETITIGQAPLSITAPSTTIQYGSAPPPVTPSYSGFVNGDSSASLADQPSCANTYAQYSAVSNTGYPTSCTGATDPNYDISYVNGSVTVTQAPLTAVIDGSQAYGGSPTFSVAGYNGLLGTDTSASVTGTLNGCTTTLVSSSGAGSYTGTISGCSGLSSTNYAITYSDGGFTVNPTALSLTVVGTQVYGAPVTSRTFTVTGTSGFTNSDSLSSLTGSLTCTSAEPDSASVAAYTGTITCSGLSDGNYAISYVDGGFNVTPAPLTITASSGSFVYGTTPPVITPSYTGLVNGDTPTSLSTPPTCSTTALSTSTVAGAPYPSSCSSAVDANYDISYVSGSVSVTPAPLTAVVEATQTYGQSPAFSVSGYNGLVGTDTSSVVAGTLTGCVTSDGASTPVGKYSGSISGCSGLTAANYTVSYSDGGLTVTPAGLAISVVGSQVYGAPVTSRTFTITGSSGFTNGDSLSSLGGSLSCNSSEPEGSRVGTYTFTISCGGLTDNNYQISYVDGGFNITPAPLSITASGGSFVYGSTPPVITASYSGFVNGDTAASLSTLPVCSTVAKSSSPVSGSPYGSSCTGAVDGNYTIAYVAGSVTVTPAPLSITASGGSFVYGSTPPVITASYSGFVNGDTAASLSTLPVCSTVAKSSSPVSGSPYASSCTGAVDGNYTIAYVAGSVTVTPAPLSITASGGSFVYGSTPPVITASYSGFVNGDTAASLSKLPACSTLATSASPVSGSPYASSCTGAVDGNYTIAYVAGSVTVTPAPLSITASGGSFVYGSTPPVITASYSGFVNGDTAASLSKLPACSTLATSASPVSGSPYASSCTGAVDGNYTITYVVGSVTVTAATTSVSYTGPTQLSTKSPFVPTATLTSSASGCETGQSVSFSLTSNPLTGANGTYPLETATTGSGGVVTGASITTSNWQEGNYTITVAYLGTSSCKGSSATSSLTTTVPGLTTTGSGTYSVTGAGTTTVSFNALLVPLTANTYLGQLTLLNSHWSFVASVTSYSKSSGTNGYLAGTGTLSWWNQSANFGLGGWVVAANNVSYTAAFTASQLFNFGSFGININYTPVAPQPTPLPNSAPVNLAVGAIVML